MGCAKSKLKEEIANDSSKEENVSLIDSLVNEEESVEEEISSQKNTFDNKDQEYEFESVNFTEDETEKENIEFNETIGTTDSTVQLQEPIEEIKIEIIPEIVTKLKSENSNISTKTLKSKTPVVLNKVKVTQKVLIHRPKEKTHEAQSQHIFSPKIQKRKKIPNYTNIYKRKDIKSKTNMAKQHFTKQSGDYSDGYEDFIDNGGRLNIVIRNQNVPANWNRLQASRFSPGFCKIKRNNNLCTALTIHLDDSDPSVKRQFLAFFNLPVWSFSPIQFSIWCDKMMMYNTMADYLSLYYLSKSFGAGTMILHAIKHFPGAVDIEMSDRFLTGKGMRRAIRFTAVNETQVYAMFRTYITALGSRIAQRTIGEFSNSRLPYKIKKHTI